MLPGLGACRGGRQEEEMLSLFSLQEMGLLKDILGLELRVMLRHSPAEAAIWRQLLPTNVNSGTLGPSGLRVSVNIESVREEKS